MYLIPFWDVDLKDTIDCNDVCNSEVKSNISEEISNVIIVIILHLAKWSRQYSQNGVSFYVASIKYDLIYNQLDFIKDDEREFLEKYYFHHLKCNKASMLALY